MKMIKRSIFLGVFFIGLANAMEQGAIGFSQDKHSLSENENLEEMEYLLNIICSDDIKSKTAEEILLDERAACCRSVEEIFDGYLQPTKLELPQIKIPYLGQDEHASNSSKKYFLLQTPKEKLALEQQERVSQKTRKRKAIVLEEDNSCSPTDVLRVDDEGAEIISLQKEMEYLLDIIRSDDIKSKTAEEILLDERADCCRSVEEIFDGYLQLTKLELPQIKIPYLGQDEHASNSPKKYFLLQTPKEKLALEQLELFEQETKKRKAIVLDEDNALKPVDVLHVDDEDAEKPSLQGNNTVLANANDNAKKLSVGLATAKAAKKRKIRRRTAPFSSDEENEVNNDVDSVEQDTSIDESNAVEQASSVGSRFSARLASKKRKYSEKESKAMFSSDEVDNGNDDEYINSEDDERELIIDEDNAENNNSKGMHKVKKRKSKLNKEYICPLCDMQIHKNYKQAHELWHTNTAHYNCEFCKMGSDDPLFLSQHVKTQNHYKLSGQSIAKKMKFNCTVEGCKKICVSERALRQHYVRKHPKPETVITCPHCIFTAVDQGAMDDHIQNVSHGKNWICASCSLNTGSKGALLQHAKTHKETQCNKCNYKAESPVKLLKHYREDKHGLDLSCEVCNEKHSSLKALNQHRLLEHQIKKWRRK